MTGSRKHQGFTLIELAIVSLIASISILAVSGIMADSFRAWQRMYDNVNSEPVVQGYTATKTFEMIVRKSSIAKISMDSNTPAKWVEVYYASSPALTATDRCAKFRLSGSSLVMETRDNSNTLLSSVNMCNSVSSCVFRRTDASITMNVIIDDGQVARAVTCTAMLHNEIE